MKKLLTLGVFALLAAGGCATSQAIKTAESPAEKLYLIGEKRYENQDYSGAIERWNNLRNNYPYSRFAVRADLRIADAYFGKQEWSTAAEQYRSFVKLHPEHPKVPYARFRVGKSVYKKMPKNWFFQPPAYERDLSSTESAVQELQRFLRRFPKSKYAPKARKMLREAKRRLADHEMYVANFYLDRKNARGAMMRLKYLLNNYSGLGLDAKALYLLAVSYLQLGDVKKARTALDDLIEYHPDSKYADKAKQYIDKHGGGGSESSG